MNLSDNYPPGVADDPNAPYNEDGIDCPECSGATPDCIYCEGAGVISEREYKLIKHEEREELEANQ